MGEASNWVLALWLLALVLLAFMSGGPPAPPAVQALIARRAVEEQGVGE